MANTDWRSGIREQLLKESEHKDMPGKSCTRCGKSGRPMAFHIFQCATTESVTPPVWFIPVSASGGTLRGRTPICDRCAPPCKKCRQPIPTKRVLSMKSRLLAELPPGSVVLVGNGICKDHMHLSAIL
jgi:hypothetical protein